MAKKSKIKNSEKLPVGIVSTPSNSPNPLPNPADVLPLIKNPVVYELISGGLMSEGIIDRDTRPVWAVTAARECLMCALGEIQGRSKKSDAFQLGFIMALRRKARPEDFGSERALAEFVNFPELNKFVHAGMETETETNASEFYEGLANGLKKGEVTISGPVSVYSVLALNWREVEKLKNLTEFHAMLQQLIGANLAGSRDRLAKLTRKIGLRFSDKGGRPRKKPGKSQKN